MEGASGEAGANMILPNYKLGKTVAIDSFGKVRIGEHVLTKHKVAIKIINHCKIKGMGVDGKVQPEIKILRLFSHPNIIHLYKVIETHSHTSIVMDNAQCGELFDYIVEKGRLREDEAHHFLQQIVSGLEYCHRNMVVHCDLVPENLLLDSEHNIKITGFGFSTTMQNVYLLRASYGSKIYAALEVISGELCMGPEVDVWGCGIILYALVCGSLPFDDENVPSLCKKIKGGIYALPDHLSTGVRDLITRMLVVEPKK